jgi:competence protein ComEC
VGAAWAARWPLLWALLHLGGVVAGGHCPGRAPTPLAAGTGWGRALCLTPLLAAGTGPAGAAAAALATFGGAAAWGWGEATARRARVDALAPRPWAPAVAVAAPGRALLRVTGWPGEATGGRWRAPARLLAFVPDPASEGDVPPAAVAAVTPGDGLLLTAGGPAPAVGQVVAARVLVTRPRGAGVPDGFDYRRHLAGRGLAWTARAPAVEIVRTTACDLPAVVGERWLAPLMARLLAYLRDLLPPREASLGGSVLLGARDPGSRELCQPYTDLGLAHLFAVSGLHVAMLLALALAPLRAVGAGPLVALLPMTALLPLYAVLTGLAGSVLRAVGAGLLTLLAPVAGRRLEPLRALGLLYLATVAWDPTGALDTGTRLSYLAVGGILAVSRATGGLRFTRRRVVGFVATALAVTMAAQWFTLPVAAQAFGRISLLSPLANLVVVPAFGLAMWLSVIALALAPLWPWAAQAAGALTWLAFRAVSGGVGWAARRAGPWDVGLPALPFARGALWVVLSALLLAGLARCRRDRRPALGLLLLVASAAAGLGLAVLPARAPWSPAPVALEVFDVGQGDCGLLALPDGWSALLDTGGSFGRGADGDGPFARDVLPWLHRHGHDRVDVAVLTHGHRDHTGGARVAAARLRIGRWVCGGRAGETLAGLPDTARATVGRPGEVLHRWRDWSVELVQPPDLAPGGRHGGENDRSLVVVLRQGARQRLLWSGDLEQGGEARLLAATPDLGAAGVWKAGHHGSDTSGSAPFLARLRPRLVLVSAGVGNRYRHPSHGAFVAAGDTLPLLRTDLQGTLSLRWDARGGRLTARPAWPAARLDTPGGPAYHRAAPP